VARRAKIVLDSSVIVKWFTKEERSDEAIRILDSLTDASLPIAVSELTFYEVANALRYKPGFSTEDVRHCISCLLQLELEVRKLDEALLGEAAKIAFDGNVTFYDAVPVVIAKLERVHCVTADRITQFLPLSRRGYPIRLLE
jgi:predicted nucleic acid-binding protein